jgi:glutathione peroxidase
MNINNFYDLTAKSIHNQDISMKEFAGKVVLVVNTASNCGLTPQYTGLEQLYLKYKDKGLVILGFPCNQFGNQEPGDENSIVNTCLRNYGVSFPMFAKVMVNGSGAHPIFTFLKAKKGGLFGSAIKWNFTKFLINHEGKVIERFSPTTKPENIEKYIQALLKKINCME